MNDTERESFEALFQHARGDGFTPSETERLWRSVVAAGPGTAGAGPTRPGEPPRTARWTSSTSTYKLAVALVVAGGVAAVGIGAIDARNTSTRAVSPVVAVSSAPASAPIVEIAAQEAANPPMVSWQDLPRAPDAHTASLHPQRARSELAPPVQILAATPSSADSPSTGALPDPIAAPEAAANPSGGSGASSADLSSSPLPPAMSEGALLLRARQSLTADPSSCLALAEEDARRFPAGPLAPEREVLAIEALARLARTAEARRRLTEFRSRYPQSPQLSHLDAVVGP